jgi:hypothetical protein
MFIYNVTTKIEETVAEDWLIWLKQEHIPEILQTGCFTHATILQLLEVDDNEGPTYAVQYYAESKALYNRYIEMFAAGLRQKVIDKWGNQFISFRTLMQVVN